MLHKSSSYQAISVVIADDHELFREGFISMINKKASDYVRVIGEAENGKELLEVVERKKPDIVVTDIKMPVMDGLEASKFITQHYPNVGIIALSMLEESSMIYDMFEAGTKGYLMKNTPWQEIVEAIQTVSRNEMHYCSTSSTSLIKKIGPSKYNQYKKNGSIYFTETEVNVIKLICKQLTTKKIASDLGICIRTVEEYSKKIKEKTEAKNIVGIALYAVKNNIVNLNEI